MVRKITIFVVMILLAISGGLLMLRRQPQMDSHSRSTRDMRVHYSCPDLEGGRRLMTCTLGRASSVTPAQSNEIAVAFCRMAEVYERGERVQMLAIMESVPDVVTNMPDRAFALAVEPIRSVLDRGFVHAEGLSDFDLSLDFERFGRINLDAVLFLGNLYLKRGGDCGLQLVYDS